MLMKKYTDMFKELGCVILNSIEFFEIVVEILKAEGHRI